MINKANHRFEVLTAAERSQGSPVSIMSDYRLDDWGSIPGRGKGFFF